MGEDFFNNNNYYSILNSVSTIRTFIKEFYLKTEHINSEYRKTFQIQKDKILYGYFSSAVV